MPRSNHKKLIPHVYLYLVEPQRGTFILASLRAQYSALDEQCELYHKSVTNVVFTKHSPKGPLGGILNEILCIQARRNVSGATGTLFLPWFSGTP